MTDLLLDIVKYLTTNLLVQGDGIDAFRDFQPPDPDNIVVLNEYAGSPQVFGVDAGVRSVQLIVRNTSSDAAKLLSWKIVNLLVKPMDPVQHVQTRWLLVSIRNSPFRLNTDAQGRVIWCANLGITTQNEY